MGSQKRVQWIYSSKNKWAKDYDKDLDQDFGWSGPRKAAEVFAVHVPKDSRSLDAGSGTGLVGQRLAANGYHSLVAMDLSQGMLEASRKKNIYIEFHQMVMGEQLGFPSDSFDAVVSVGVLTVGHAPAGSLDELARITRPAGHVVFILRPDVYVTAGFKEKQQELESLGIWELVDVTEEFQPLPKGEPEVYHQVWVYRIK